MRELIDLCESSGDLSLIQLPYGRGALSPVMSKSTVDFHYGVLAKAYVERFNAGTGNKSFNEAGAYLHNLFFAQFKSPGVNRPHGSALNLMLRGRDTFQDFKDDFKEAALKLSGSGWIYLSRTGAIRTIQNHQKRPDIVLLLDMWEHAYQNDYHGDKAKYVDNFWRIINWDAINHRI